MVRFERYQRQQVVIAIPDKTITTSSSSTCKASWNEGCKDKRSSWFTRYQS